MKGIVRIVAAHAPMDYRKKMMICLARKIRSWDRSTRFRIYSIPAVGTNKPMTTILTTKRFAFIGRFGWILRAFH
jgi:hypothetical protein